MERTAVESPDGLPFSHAVRWGDLVFTAGQVGSVDPLAPDIETQARQALDALEDALTKGGASIESVLRVEAFLASADHVGAWNEAFTERFPTSPPARTTLVAGFVVPGLLIEVQAVAGRVAGSA